MFRVMFAVASTIVVSSGRCHLPKQLPPAQEGSDDVENQRREKEIVPTIMEETLRDDMCLEACVVPCLVFLFLADSCA